MSGPASSATDLFRLRFRKSHSLDGCRAALVRSRLIPGLISSLPGMAGLPPFISFSASYPDLDPAVHRHILSSTITTNTAGR